MEESKNFRFTAAFARLLRSTALNFRLNSVWALCCLTRRSASTNQFGVAALAPDVFLVAVTGLFVGLVDGLLAVATAGDFFSLITEGLVDCRARGWAVLSAGLATFEVGVLTPGFFVIAVTRFGVTASVCLLFETRSACFSLR